MELSAAKSRHVLRVGAQACALVFLAMMISGCRRHQEKQAAQQQALMVEMDARVAEIERAQSSGQFDEAARLAKDALEEARYVAYRERFFGLAIDNLLAQGRDATVADMIHDAWQREPGLARSVLGRLHAHYQQQNRPDADYAWARRLLALGAVLPDDIRPQVLEWQFGAALMLDDPALAQTAADEMVAALNPGEVPARMEPHLLRQIQAGRHAVSEALLQHLERRVGDKPPFGEMIAGMRMQGILAHAEWERFADAFHLCVARMEDGRLSELLRQIFPALQKAQRLDLVEAASRHVIFNASARPQAVKHASRIWVEQGFEHNRKTLPERLDALLNASVCPLQVGHLFDRYFYQIIDDPEIVRALCEVGKRILAACADTDAAQNIKVKILDGAFIMENYDLAVQMLEQGIPGRDKAWHDMTLPKVKAHRAQARNQPREAVAYFRAFMQAWIDSEQEEEYDPSSGIAYSKEWILGRNANRIANILESIPDAAEAKRAREEARDYFRAAIRKAAHDPDALKLLQEETRDMNL